MNLGNKFLPPLMWFFHWDELLSPKVFAPSGGFSREKKPYHDQGDSLVWMGPLWTGPLAVAFLYRNTLVGKIGSCGRGMFPTAGGTPLRTSRRFSLRDLQRLAFCAPR